MNQSQGSINYKQQIEEYAFNQQISVDEAFHVFESALRDTLIELRYQVKKPAVKINKKTGKISLYDQRYIVEEALFKNQISIEYVQKALDEKADMNDLLMSRTTRNSYNSDPKIEDIFLYNIPMPHFDKKFLLKLKSSICKWTRILKNAKQYEIYKDRVGTLISCRAKEIEFVNAVVELDEGNGILRKDDMVKGEAPNKILSDDVNVNSIKSKSFKAIISEVKRDDFGWQVFLSRKSNDFLRALMASEIDEVSSGKIIIKEIARFPGERAKVIVHSTDRFFDAVGACVGFGGIRINAISKECNGEKIDIVNWSPDPEKLIRNIFSPVEIKEIVVGDKLTEIVVNNESLKMAIGFKGYNIRLASKLLNVHFEVCTEDNYKNTKSKYIENKSSKLQEALEVDEFLSKFLVLEGFTSPFDIDKASTEELMLIDGCDDELAEALKNRTDLYLNELKSSLCIEDDLWNVDFIDREIIIELAKSEAKVKTIEDLAGLSRDEFIESLQSEFLESLNIVTEKKYTSPSSSILKPQVTKLNELPKKTDELSQKDAVDTIILTARKKINWISS